MTTKPLSPTRTREERALEPPYVVMLHNDEVNSMTHVVESLQICVPGLSHEQAAEIMLAAHHDGQARVIVCPREEARRHRDCLESSGLTATIEPA